eukprot:g15539.t1
MLWDSVVLRRCVAACRVRKPKRRKSVHIPLCLSVLDLCGRSPVLLLLDLLKWCGLFPRLCLGTALLQGPLRTHTCQQAVQHPSRWRAFAAVTLDTSSSSLAVSVFSFSSAKCSAPFSSASATATQEAPQEEEEDKEDEEEGSEEEDVEEESEEEDVEEDEEEEEEEGSEEEDDEGEGEEEDEEEESEEEDYEEEDEDEEEGSEEEDDEGEGEQEDEEEESEKDDEEGSEEEGKEASTDSEWSEGGEGDNFVRCNFFIKNKDRHCLNKKRKSDSENDTWRCRYHLPNASRSRAGDRDGGFPSQSALGISSATTLHPSTFVYALIFRQLL